MISTLLSAARVDRELHVGRPAAMGGRHDREPVPLIRRHRRDTGADDVLPGGVLPAGGDRRLRIPVGIEQDPALLVQHPRKIVGALVRQA